MWKPEDEVTTTAGTIWREQLYQFKQGMAAQRAKMITALKRDIEASCPDEKECESCTNLNTYIQDLIINLENETDEDIQLSAM